MLQMILLVFAFVLTIICAVWQNGWRVPPHLGWLGIALFILTFILR